MKIVKTIQEMRKLWAAISGTVGFIPTMGYLHEGHISLIELAKKENDYVVVSIFVNPKQFGPDEDFKSYPRNEKSDVTLLEKAGVDVLFFPDANEMYPGGFATYVSVEKLSDILEGAKRPGHFTGVTTVLTKLFNIIQPTVAYFGQKDAQQVFIVKKMVSDLAFPVSIIVGETVREKDGLAKSSRNVYLNKNERKQAAILFQSLQKAQDMFQKGEKDTMKLKRAMEELIKTKDSKIDYISVADPETLEEEISSKKGSIVSLAVYFGKTRLIDNIILV
jgi:pantoate--beta-alanine ligase